MTRVDDVHPAAENGQPLHRLPPGPGLPKVVQGLPFGLSRRHALRWLTQRYGPVFTVNLPMYGRSVIIADPGLAKQVFLCNTEALGNVQPNLSRILGHGSVFGLDGAEHRRRRSLLTPSLHGRSVRAYEAVMVEETLREAATWPIGTPFATLEPMMRITLNVILRNVFGADGAALQELLDLVPRFVTLGTKYALVPMPSRTYGRLTPWGRLAHVRRQYDAAVGKLIDARLADPGLPDRSDVLSLFLKSHYPDGSTMSRQDISDELLTLIAAGHETTATTLAWSFERLTRQPGLLDALSREADTDENQLRRAALREVQRTRSVVDTVARHVYAPSFELGEWVLPRGTSIIIAISQIHQAPSIFEEPDRFDPQRFLDTTPPPGWIPFGGGTRRCVGSAFADLEMDVTLRTILRQFHIHQTSAPSERWHTRGLTFAPKAGGLVTLSPRTPKP